MDWEDQFEKITSHIKDEMSSFDEDEESEEVTIENVIELTELMSAAIMAMSAVLRNVIVDGNEFELDEEVSELILDIRDELLDLLGILGLDYSLFEKEDPEED